MDQIPYYDLKDEIQGILDSDEYKENISDPDRIECKQAMYSVIQYSKFLVEVGIREIILIIVITFSG